MGRYNVELKRSAVKEIKRLPAQDLKKILAVIERLCENPRPTGCEKLCAQEKYRLRCGRYRILYTIEDERLVVCIIKIGHRKDV
ncbi:MAG: type II toxin-antitoxin system RelE/ParE family toxin [Candidatus Omnitrophota bacterium]